MYNDVNAESMFEHIKEWMGKDEGKRERVVWNSAKVVGVKTDFMHRKNYVKKVVLMLVAVLIAIIALAKRLKRLLRSI